MNNSALNNYIVKMNQNKNVRNSTKKKDVSIFKIHAFFGKNNALPKNSNAANFKMFVQNSTNKIIVQNNKKNVSNLLLFVMSTKLFVMLNQKKFVLQTNLSMMRNFVVNKLHNVNQKYFFNF